jgi:hypothetical protein
MINQGKCSNVRPAITEAVCDEMCGRNALVCRDCSGPAPVDELPPLDDVSVTTTTAGDLVQSVKEAAIGRPGFFVDFSGHEDLLAKFKAAADSRGMRPGESALDLVYLFVEGLLFLQEELEG